MTRFNQADLPLNFTFLRPSKSQQIIPMLSRFWKPKLNKNKEQLKYKLPSRLINLSYAKLDQRNRKEIDLRIFVLVKNLLDSIGTSQQGFIRSGKIGRSANHPANVSYESSCTEWNIARPRALRHPDWAKYESNPDTGSVGQQKPKGTVILTDELPFYTHKYTKGPPILELEPIDCSFFADINTRFRNYHIQPNRLSKLKPSKTLKKFSYNIM